MEAEYKIIDTESGKTLDISGRLDTNSACEMEKGIQSLLDDPGNALTIALGSLTYISSSGLRCLVRLYNAAKSKGADFRIIDIQPSVLEIFKLTGLNKVFGI